MFEPVSSRVDFPELDRRVIQYSVKKLRNMMVVWKVGNGRKTGYEYVTKDRLQQELMRLLITKFVNDEIDEATFLQLKKELDKERKG